MIKPKNRHAPQEPVKPARARDSIFKTIPVDLSAKVKVVINASTTVYVDPGKDVEKVKAKYLNSLAPKKIRF